MLLVGTVPSKTYLLFLDALIIVLQWVMVTIAYEDSLLQDDHNIETILFSSPKDTPTRPHSPEPSTPSSPTLTPLISQSAKHPPIDYTDLVMDLHLGPLMRRLGGPAVITRRPSDASLPLPNTMGIPLPASLRMFLRARAEFRRRAEATAANANAARQGEGANADRRERRVPGAMSGDGGE